jgi:hypothetical protein
MTSVSLDLNGFPYVYGGPVAWLAIPDGMARAVKRPPPSKRLSESDNSDTRIAGRALGDDGGGCEWSSGRCSVVGALPAPCL